MLFLLCKSPQIVSFESQFLCSALQSHKQAERTDTMLNWLVLCQVKYSCNKNTVFLILYKLIGFITLFVSSCSMRELFTNLRQISRPYPVNSLIDAHFDCLKIYEFIKTLLNNNYHFG